MKLDIANLNPQKTFEEILKEEKELIYSVLFYTAGLLVGSLGFSLIKSEMLIKGIKAIFTPHAGNLTSIFICNFALYISIFAVTVLLGLFLIGYPIINSIPLMIGCSVGLKVAFFYITYGVKGVGYSLLLVIPQAAIFTTVVVYTIRQSAQISRYILKCVSSKEAGEPLKVKSLLKRYITYTLAVIAAAFVNALFTFLLSDLIKI